MAEIKHNEFCPIPFDEFEIHWDGNVYLCCPAFNNYYSCGNVFENSFDDVWNSEKAIDFRNKIMNNDYSLCNSEACYLCKSKKFIPDFETSYKAKMEEYPKKIKLCYDSECNLACLICRDKIGRLSAEQLEKWNDKIETFLVPMLKDVKVLTLNAAGEVFASRHSRKLIKRVTEMYPNIKFEFLTNGTLCNEQTFKDLNIKPEQIHTIRISMHAATKKTYSVMVKNGELYYDKLLENLKYLGELKKKYGFLLYWNFVVTSLNYKDMPKYAAMAKIYNAVPFFWEYRKNQSSQHLENVEIWEENHPKHKDFVRVLKHPNMYIFKDCLYPKLKKCQIENPKYSLWERLQLLLNIY